MIRIENHGPLIVATNFWESEYAARGAFFLSLNAGAFRLLVPAQHQKVLRELHTAREVVISRGPWPEMRRDEAIEVLFDDRSDDPFALHLGLEQIDRLPADDDQVREWLCTIWTAPRRGRPHKALEKKAYYRRVPEIPYLMPWSEQL